MRVCLIVTNARIMKKIVKPAQVPSRKTNRRAQGTARTSSDDMRSHYDFDYAKSRPNRFAERLAKSAVVVVLDPDVANVFQSAEAVNKFLRSAISAMPHSEPSKKRAS